MNITKYDVTDNITKTVRRGISAYDMEEYLVSIFDVDRFAYEDKEGTEHSIRDVIRNLARKLSRGDDTREEEALLNITIRHGVDE